MKSARPIVTFATLAVACAPTTIASTEAGAPPRSSVAANAPESPPPIGAWGSQPGEGVLCAVALYSAAVDVGRRCYPDSDEAFQAELERAVGRLDTYVLQNSNMTPAEHASFKKEHSLASAPTEAVCQGDFVGIYQGLASAGAERLHAHVDGLVSRPGNPTWGDCL